MAVLSLRDPNVRTIRKTHPKVRNAEVLGKGKFCRVFVSDNPAHVLKLTADRAHAEYLTDPCSPQGRHKPVVIANHGVVGETSHGLPIHLIEVERLQKLRRGSANGRLVNQIVKFVNDQSGWRYLDKSTLLPQPDDGLGIDPDLLAFMGEVNLFTANFQCRIDAHFANFMQREDQTLVLSDPVFDDSALNFDTDTAKSNWWN